MAEADEPVDTLVWLCTTARVGQNAVLDAIRAVVPGANEGLPASKATNGVLVHTIVTPDQYRVVPHSRWVLVWMRRRDRAAQAVSLAYSRATNWWHSIEPRPGDPPYDPSAVALAARHLAEQDIAWRRWMHGRAHIDVWYEDHIQDDPAVAAQMILDDAGIPGQAGPAVRQRFAGDIKAAWLAQLRSAS